MRLIALGFVGFASLSNSARLSLNRRHAAEPFEGWQKDVTSFVCMKKWSKSLWGDTGQYCLVDLKQMVAANKKGIKSKEKYKMSVSLRWKTCQYARDGYPKAWGMKVCDLKGKEDVRVSYSSKRNVPKACFRIAAEDFIPDGKNKVDVLEASLSANDCKVIGHIAHKRGKFAPTATHSQSTPAPTVSLTTSTVVASKTTTSTTVPTTTTTKTTTTTTSATTTSASSATSAPSDILDTDHEDEVSEDVAAEDATSAMSSTTPDLDDRNPEMDEEQTDNEDEVSEDEADEETTTVMSSTTPDLGDGGPEMEEEQNDQEEDVSEDETDEEMATSMSSTTPDLADEIPDAEEPEMSEEPFDQADVEEKDSRDDEVSQEEADANEEIATEEPAVPPEAEETLDLDGAAVENMFEFWRQKEAEA